MEAIDYEEPIYELALECQGLFKQQIIRLKDGDDSNGSRTLSDFNDRFNAWAAFLGVFAESNLCLDRRLRHHVTIQDQVLRLLDIMQRNLEFLFDGHDLQDHMDIRLPNGFQPSLSLLPINIDCLEGISEVLDRLSRLGISIRQSSVTDKTTKARKLPEAFDLRHYEELAYLCLKSLYPDASDGLLNHITQSMRETYALYLRRKYRQEQLQAPRARPKPQRFTPTALPSVSEESAENAGGRIASKEPQPGKNHVSNFLRNKKARDFPMSEPTSVNTHEVQVRFKRTMGSSARDGAMSILDKHQEYPKAPKGNTTCEWCFGPLSKDLLDEVRWRRHINEDHKPYICISEHCSELLPRYATSMEWLQHMLTIHGNDWNRDVYAPSSWACPLCMDEHATFPSSSNLSEHIDSAHGGLFTEPQVQAIVQQSRFRLPRLRNICPLCCLPAMDHRESQQKEKHHECGATSINKEVRINTDSTKLDQNRGNNLNPESNLHKSKPNVRSSHGMIASHVAAHLENILLLSLRLISIDVQDDTPEDGMDGSGPTDYQSSLSNSGTRFPNLDLDEIENPSSSSIDEANQNNEHLENTIPDSDYISWHDVLDVYEGPSKPDLETRSQDEAIDQLGNENELGEDLEEFIANPPTRSFHDRDTLGPDLEYFISHPPMGESLRTDYLDRDLEEFIASNPDGVPDDSDLGGSLENFIQTYPI